MLTPSIALGVFVLCAITSYADAWKIYNNPQFGYALHYPANGNLVDVGADVRNGFYLDPLQPIADLTANPAFSQLSIAPHSIVKIVFPDKYLIMLVLDQAPPKTPPPGSQPVSIGKYTFYQRHSWDAGMCHNYDYYTYFLERGSRYYVFIFLFTSNCFANQNTTESSYRANIHTKNLETILNTLQLT